MNFRLLCHVNAAVLIETFVKFRLPTCFQTNVLSLSCGPEIVLLASDAVQVGDTFHCCAKTARLPRYAVIDRFRFQSAGSPVDGCMLAHMVSTRPSILGFV